MAAEALPNFDRAPESRASSSPHGWGDRAWITDCGGVKPWPVKTAKKCPKNMDISMGFKYVQTTCSIEMWWQMPFDLIYIQKKMWILPDPDATLVTHPAWATPRSPPYPLLETVFCPNLGENGGKKGQKTMGHNGGFPMGSLKTMGFNTEMVDDLDDFWW